jgi:hypothetical protein
MPTSQGDRHEESFQESLPEPTVLRNLRAKLNPSRFPRMSPVMGAIVSFVVGAPFGDPPIAEIVIVHDGAVLARPEGTVKAQIIGCYDDLIRNWQALSACAGLKRSASRPTVSLPARLAIHHCEEPSRNMWATPAEYVVLLNRSSWHRVRSRRWTSWRECDSHSS